MLSKKQRYDRKTLMMAYSACTQEARDRILRFALEQAEMCPAPYIDERVEDFIRKTCEDAEQWMKWQKRVPAIKRWLDEQPPQQAQAAPAQTPSVINPNWGTGKTLAALMVMVKAAERPFWEDEE